MKDRGGIIGIKELLQPYTNEEKLQRMKEILLEKEKEKKKRGWFAIRNADYWFKQKPLQYRLHLNGELDAPEFPNIQQEELFNEKQ